MIVIIIFSIWLVYCFSVYHIPEPIIRDNTEEIKIIRHHQLIRDQSEELQKLRGDRVP